MTNTTNDSSVLLDVRNLRTTFTTEYGHVPAVDGVSWSVRRGETLAIVGESGCGKSVTALSIMRLIPDPPGRILGGEVLFHDDAASEPSDLLSLPDRQMRRIRGNRIAMVFQEPMSALNPVLTIGDQIGYHIFDRRPEADVMPFVRSHGMGIMAYGSMAHGLLTGSWSADQSFGDDDWRKNGANFGINNWGPDNLAANVAAVEKLKGIAADHGKTIAQLAIAWVLDNPAVSVALAGAKKPAEIIEDLGGDWDLPDGLKKEIDDLVLAEGSGVGLSGMEIAT